MTTYHARAEWTSTRAAGSPMPSNPAGVAVHWPGSTHPLGNPSQTTIANRLEGYRRFHVSGNGWSDIAYQVGFDQSGGVWDLRGIDRMSAANGNSAVNARYGAVLFLLGPGEEPSPAMLTAFNDWRRDRWLRAYPGATAVVGHCDVRPQGTTCPGGITHALIRSGRILTSTPTPAPPEDDMSAAAEQAIGKYLDAPVSMAAGHAKSASAQASRLLVEVAGLKATVQTLAEAVATDRGVDPAELIATVDRALRDKLDNLTIDVREK